MEEPTLASAVAHFRSRYSKNADRRPFPVIATTGDVREYYAQTGTSVTQQSDGRIDTEQITAFGFRGETIIAKVLKDWWPGIPDWVTESPNPGTSIYDTAEDVPDGIGKAFLYEKVQKFMPVDCECLENHYRNPGEAWLLRMDPPLDGHTYVVAHRRSRKRSPFSDLSFYPARPAKLDGEWAGLVEAEAWSLTGSVVGTTLVDLALRFAGKQGYSMVRGDLTDLPDKG